MYIGILVDGFKKLRAASTMCVMNECNPVIAITHMLYQMRVVLYKLLAVDRRDVI